MFQLIPGTVAAQQVQSVQDDNLIRRLLSEASQRQTRDLSNAPVRADFRFTDVQPASGITFRHRMTDDSGKAEKPVHYDHGSGMAVADVDADGLPDLYFANQVGGNTLWRNLGGSRFEDITSKAGVAVPGRVSVGAAFGDLDNDGDPDLVVSTVRGGNLVFRNAGQGRFEDITSNSGIRGSTHASGIVLFDFNRDGLLDVFITSIGRYTSDSVRADGTHPGLADAFSGHLFPERAEKPFLYRNEGDGRFTDVSETVLPGGTGWSGDATACDFNEDGWPDLYVLNMQGDDHYLVNEGGKRFVDRTSSTFGRTPWGAMGVTLLDANLDGRVDLFVTDMHSDMTGGQIKLRSGFNLGAERQKSEAWCSAQWTDAFLQGASNNVFGNALQLGGAGGQFEERSDAFGVETFWPWGASAADFNADGSEDLFITAGMGFPFAYSVNSLLLNESGRRFRAAEFVTGIEPRRGGRVSSEAFVLDFDGADRDHAFRRGRAGKLSVLGALSSRSSCAVDLDNDGDLDLVTNEFNDVPQVLTSSLGSRPGLNSLAIRLRGTRSNRDGLGAKVKVTAGGRAQVRWHHGKSGYLGQSSLPIYFGLGDSTAPELIEVTWPSGARQEVREGLKGIRTITLTEPAGP